MPGDLPLRTGSPIGETGDRNGISATHREMVKRREKGTYQCSGTDTEFGNYLCVQPWSSLYFWAAVATMFGWPAGAGNNFKWVANGNF